jgi:hypothetical protein
MVYPWIYHVYPSEWIYMVHPWIYQVYPLSIYMVYPWIYMVYHLMYVHGINVVYRGISMDIPSFLKPDFAAGPCCWSHSMRTRVWVTRSVLFHAPPWQLRQGKGGPKKAHDLFFPPPPSLSPPPPPLPALAAAAAAVEAARASFLAASRSRGKDFLPSQGGG